MFRWMPDRPFGKSEAAARLKHGGVFIYQLAETRIKRDMSHGSLP
jgi:hypothetical protein